MASASFKFVRVEPAPSRSGVAVVWICKEPVNSMDMHLWSELDGALTSIESAKDAPRAVIFASGLKRHIFTAGNDLNELNAAATTKERFAGFWRAQTHFLAHLLRSPLVTVAAIKGACPAGGCITSLCCDYRVMTEKGHIGLNEVKIGVPVPEVWCKVMQRIVGPKAERLLLTGKTCAPSEAHALGLVDEVVPADKLMDAARAAAQRFVKAAKPAGYAGTKFFLRGDLSAALADGCEAEIVSTWGFLSRDDVKGMVQAYLSALGGGGGGKGKGGARAKL